MANPCKPTGMTTSIFACLLLIAAAILMPVAAGAATPATTPSFAKLGQGIDDVMLTDENGHTIPWRSLKGQPRALFFGFTHCPVVCPVTVWELDSALLEMGDAARGIKVSFVTLDPARDTPAVLKSYFSGFRGRVAPLSGQAASINRIARAFEVSVERVDTGKGDYTLDHTATVFLIDPAGRVVDTVAFGAQRDLIVQRLKKLASPGR